MHDGADVRDPRGSGGTLRSVLLIKAFTLRLGSGILFDLDCVKSISDNQREVLAFGGYLLRLGAGARKSAPFFRITRFSGHSRVGR